MAYNPNNPNGSATSANSAPVVIASDQAAIPINDNGGSLTVDGTVGVSGTVTISGTVTANAGTGTQNVSVQNASIPVTDNGGSLTIDGSVSVSNFPATQPVSGTLELGATTLAALESITVENAAGASAVNIQDGGNSITIDGSVSVSNFPATQPVSGTIAATQSGTWNVGLSTGANAIGSITNTSFAATQSGTWSVDLNVGAAPHNFGYTLIHKDGEYSTAQTGTALWTPTSTKKFVVTDLSITTGGTTAGIVTLWQGASGDTSYTLGTDPAIFRGEFAPSSTSKPGAIKSFNVPYVSTTADHILRVTTSAAITVYIQINGYEI